MAADVLIINPNPLLNLVHAGDFTPEAVNRVPSLAMMAEGKGVNVARVLARHGHSVILTGFAGGHSGAWLRDLVRADAVRDAFVEAVAPLRVGFMASGQEAHHPTTVFPGGFPVTAAECRILLERVDSLLASVSLVIASGSVPDPAANEIYAEVLALCRQKSVPCWVDAYGPAMQKALAGPAPPGLAKPNREEFTEDMHWDRVGELHITDGGGPISAARPDGERWRVFPPLIRQAPPGPHLLPRGLHPGLNGGNGGSSEEPLPL